MKFSLIIPCYNVGAVLPVTLPSYLKQTTSVEYEVICVDDGSRDDTQAILNQHEHQERLHIHRHRQNRGLAAARNTGIKAARGDLLVFVDGDVELAPDFLEQVEPWFNDESFTGVMMITHPAPEVTMDKFQRFLYQRLKRYPKKGLIPVPYRRFLFNATVVRAGAIEQAGLFDEHFQTYGVEDTEYAYRLYQRSPGKFFASQNPPSWHHHYHTFQEYCHSLYRCGFRNVPYLNSIKPQVAALFGTTYAAPSKDAWWTGLVGSVVLQPWLARGAQWCYRWVPFPGSNAIVRYLGLYYLVRGYRDWLLKHRVAGDTGSTNPPPKSD